MLPPVSNVHEMSNQANILKANLSKQVVTKKKISVANAIINGHNELLFLRRAPNEEFHPLTWCLPGGGVDEYEDVLTAVKRETREETGIDEGDYVILKCMKVDYPEITIYYFLSILVQHVDPFVVLDEDEHSNYMWCGRQLWNDLDLILDLKTHVNELTKSEQLG